MSISDINWLAIGAYNGAVNAINARSTTKLCNTIEAEARALSDDVLENKLRALVVSADDNVEIFYQIWDRIEEYKRDHPVVLFTHLDSYWQNVGTERYPFALCEFVRITGKKNLSKADAEVRRLYQGRVVTLLMNTYEKFSYGEAIRYVNRVRETGMDVSFTLSVS